LEIFLDDYKSGIYLLITSFIVCLIIGNNFFKAKSEIELRHLREEVVSLRGDLKKEENTSTRNQQKIKKKLAEHVSFFYLFFLFIGLNL